ncbi:cytochrome P450 [Streptomyces sp. NPDC127159]|uniref:cytochrome P450 n=1 Tax=unclassified Streptomyces TaxID=2593676 RepID=UPI003628E281
MKMNSSQSERRTIPFVRISGLEFSGVYDEVRQEGPLVKVRTPAGDLAWLVVGYDEAKVLLGSRTARRAHRNPAEAAMISRAGVMAGPVGNYDTEFRDHGRMRRILAPAFATSRTVKLEPYIRSLVTDLISDLIAARTAGDDPVDFHSLFSVPLPVFVICELLGVPQADRIRFRDLSERASMFVGPNPRDAMEELIDYCSHLLGAKRTTPTSDVLSDLAAAQAKDDDFPDYEASRIAAGLLFAGHETTLIRLDIGLVKLLDAALYPELPLTGGERLDKAIEEIIRVAACGDMGLVRYASEPIDIGGVRIEEGDAIIISTAGANSDPNVFENPHEFIPDRSDPAPQLGFGHGAHFCLGARLAKLEMKIAFEELARRLPNLRIAEDPQEIEFFSDRLLSGLERLPVTW